jgi:hypothetical protein
MTIPETIQKAIDGGYKCCDRTITARGGVVYHIMANLHENLLDPLFWQSLGKAMRWDYGKCCKECGSNSIPDGDGHCGNCYAYFSGSESGTEYWLYQWHRFIDHLAEGNTIESYFLNF